MPSLVCGRPRNGLYTTFLCFAAKARGLHIVGHQSGWDVETDTGGGLELAGFAIGSGHRRGMVDVGGAGEVVEQSAKPVACLGHGELGCPWFGVLR